MATLVILFFISLFNIISECIPYLTKKVSKSLNNDALREKNLWSDMSLLKKQLHTIDMIDEFSKYAKVERKIQKVQNEINTINKTKSSTMFMVKVAANVVYQILQEMFLIGYFISKGFCPRIVLRGANLGTRMFNLMVICMVTLIWSYRRTPLLHVPEDWLFPLGRLVAFPTGVSGALGVTMWLMMCRSVVNKALKPATSYIGTLMLNKGIDMSEYNGDIPLD